MQTVYPSYNETLKKWIVCYIRFNTFEDADKYAKEYEEGRDLGPMDYSALSV